MTARTMFEGIHDFLTDAMADIRQKVVEEPWFGRVVTERGDATAWPDAKEAQPQNMKPAPESNALHGEILGPEQQRYQNAGYLEHGQVIDGQAMHVEPRWPEALTHDSKQEYDLDIDIDR